MPKAEPVSVRIYCLCGQKMKVSDAMYGRPGKCVACRQKIRIPRRDEVPAGVSGVYEIYLKDHPELLRKPTPPAAPEETDDGASDAEDLPLGDAVEEDTIIPLDVFEPLRVLCSFEQKVERYLQTLRKNKMALVEGLDKATLMSYRALARNARSNLDDLLRQRLHEVSEQLAGTMEQIARATLAVRVGEMDYESFLRGVAPLRQRRERLELRRHNLRGWLAVTDSHMAGGYIDVRLEDVPVEGIEVTFPLDEKSGSALVDLYAGYLRDALTARERAERKLVERQRMQKEGALSGATLEDCRADAEAERERARAAVAFYRIRLEQIAKDSDNDIKSAKVCLELARVRLDANELERGAFQAAEMALLRSQSDNAMARDLARRALSANVGSDVPRVTGTFLRRMGPRGVPSGIGLDSWIAWLAAILMMVNTVVPISDAQEGGNMVVAGAMVIGFLIVGALLAMFAAIPQRRVRGILMTALWLFAAIVGVVHLQRTWYSLGIVGVAMRSNPHWYLSHGITLFGITLLLMFFAAGVSLFPFTRMRYLPLTAAAVGLGVIAMALTDAGGILGPRPYVQEAESTPSMDHPGLYDVSVMVGNAGWGRRSFWLGGVRGSVPNPVTFLLERRIGSDSWNDVGAPLRLKRDEQPWSDVTRPQVFPQIEIKAGHKVVLAYRLEPDTYRVQMISLFDKQAPLVKTFTLVPLAPGPEPEPKAAEEAAQTGIGDDDAAKEAALGEGESEGESEKGKAALEVVRLDLRGVMNGEGRRPSFSIELHLPTGEIISRRLELGGVVYGSWKAQEFSPVQKSLTVSDGKRLLILQPGESLDLEIPPPEPEGQAPPPPAAAAP